MRYVRLLPGLVLTLAMLLSIPAGAAAETLTVVVQRSGHLAGVSDVADVHLYAGMPGHNYGGFPYLAAGSNVANEPYITLLRFGLETIPPQANVLQATVFLHTRWPQTPPSPCVVDAHPISPGNAGWVEGEARGYAVAGAACWSERAHGEAQWIGGAGLANADADYSLPPIATATISPQQTGWIRFELAREAAQRWVSDPGTNTGMRLSVRGAQKAGNLLGVHSSESAEAPELRPKLVLKVEMDDNLQAEYWKRRAERVIAEAADQLKRAATAAAEVGSPGRAQTRLGRLTGQLDETRQAARAVDRWDGTELERIATQTSDIRRAAHRLVRRLPVLRAVAANAARRLPTDFALGVADSMEHVMHPVERFTGDFPDRLALSLARNEFEAAQVVIVPADRPVRGMTWHVTDLRGPGGATIPAEDIRVSPVGYARSHKPADSREPADWWPCPILDFLDTIDVDRGTVQSLWLLVRTGEGTRTGLYRGKLTVSGDGVEPKSLSLSVRVFDFTVPREQHLKTLCHLYEQYSNTVYGDDRHEEEGLAERMFQMVLDHRLAVTNLYAMQSGPGQIGPQNGLNSVGLPSIAEPEDLRRLWEAGSRWWNLGYLHPAHAKRAGKTIDEITPIFIEMMREALALADAAGWPHENLGIYLYDEAHTLDELNRVAGQVKSALPDITVMTTAYDTSFGVRGGPIDNSIDAWCPLTPSYVAERPTIQEGRKAGKQVWWYVACGPREPHLNFFVQQQPICARLLMGAAAQKYRPDGFLYYYVNGWGSYKEPLSRWPLTDWVPFYQPGPDGDGQLICPGPEGPVSTVAFEGIRDGLEDYEYYWLLGDMAMRAREEGLDVSAAERLLEVPADLLSSLRAYTEQPARLRAEREAIAAEIERLQRCLKRQEPAR